MRRQEDKSKMSLRSNIVVKGFTTGVVAILLLAMALMVNAQCSNPKEVDDYHAKQPKGIAVCAKILNLDPIKGDVTLRLEFVPGAELLKEGDNTLVETIKFDTTSANGKQEILFEKGKRMYPTEVVLNMYGEKKEGSNYVSVVEDYPFDSHKADVFLYFYTKPEKKKEAPKEPNAGEGEVKKEAEVEAPTEEEVPHSLFFTPASPGYTIASAKSKDSDEGYTDLNLSITRSPMVILFATFIMLLMWGVTLAVAALIFTVVILGRKAEIAMFSFITTLLFAFVTVRNSLPGTPPVGTFLDYLSFFWVEAILGVCLVTVVVTWVFRKPA
jgi:hypothetical protein